MSIFYFFKRNSNTKSAIGLVVGSMEDDSLECRGYTSLANNPEVFTACRKIASLISSMPIMLMENGKSGDIRFFNRLSRTIDIQPNSHMTRRTWMESIVMTMLLYGKGNSVVKVYTDRGYIADMEPVPAGRVSFVPPVTGMDYKIQIDGKTYDPDEVLHFVDNPDRDYPWKG